MTRPILFVLCFAFMCSISNGVLAGERYTVTYPRPDGDFDERSRYSLKLLELALQKAGVDYTLQPSKLPMQQGRALVMLEKGLGEVNITWSMTSIEREERLLPIRIPICRGLIGWRIALITADQPDLLAAVRTRADLAKLLAGQGHDWPDTTILRANRLPTLGVVGYQSLFKTLLARRYDYFPRSVSEIWAEASEQLSAGIMVDPYIAIHYPAASYFFVNKQNLRLANWVHTGLERALADGSFEQLFQQEMRDSLIAARLDKRVIIELDNPLLPPATPLNRRELWYRPRLAAPSKPAHPPQ
ncbi:hypothetical protein HNQ59_000231 [Chitinivorax tropicus]|uniref:Transporter substrate-binding domain-containing protein n=1 Tax=Chitinivorax tropicus TaxID=714531 RepID=A0A840MIE7_9PROT|nr:transporter substrate-binding domain-containing protein [Chitinivorax tropicus]MBB5016969.1 hypothetical protein [Chitinivorax tropicus]